MLIKGAMKKLVLNLFLIIFCCICFSEKKPENYYELFDVPQNATERQIHAAYIRLAGEYHPDKYTDPKKKKTAEEMFKQIQEWYNVLKDPEQRRLYDQYLRETASDSEKEDFKDWKDNRRFLKNRGYGGTSSSARNSANGGANSSSSRSHQSAGNRGYGGANSSSKRSGPHSQNDSVESYIYFGTQLHHAIKSEDPAKAHRFVANLLNIGGFDINAKDSNGDTALALAFKRTFPKNDKVKIINLILTAEGLDINAKDSNGDTVLILALAYAETFDKIDRVRVIKNILAVEGLDINAQDRNGDTALAWAVTRNKDRIALLLLKAGADPNIPGSDGPLLHELLSRMANRREKGGYYDGNNIPLQLVKEGMKSSFNILRYLQQYGIDTALKNSAGWTPLHFSLLKNFYYYSFRNVYRDYWEANPIEYTKKLIDFLIRNGFADYLINNPQEREQIDSLFVKRGLSDEFHLLSRRLARKRSERMRLVNHCWAIFKTGIRL